MSDFSDRLREERTRLRLNQEEMGQLGGVKKLAQFNYEKGERMPDAEYLGLLLFRGVDVQYLLTGIRTDPATLEPFQRAADITRRSGVAAEEKSALWAELVAAVMRQGQVVATDLLDLADAYRSCAASDREVLLRVAKALSGPGTEGKSAKLAPLPGVTIHGDVGQQIGGDQVINGDQSFTMGGAAKKPRKPRGG